MKISFSHLRYNEMKSLGIENKHYEFPDRLMNEDWALKIHDQTLKRLNERGGMSVDEIMMNIHRWSFKQLDDYVKNTPLKKQWEDIQKCISDNSMK